ncbi:MAG: extracellular solute-binding protein [Candidatus Peribacteria bacterium]|nr:MAG: extracellular solute-binding protein [Candidatus Peribacteria bacterium]
MDGENAYNAKYAGMKSEGVNNLDAFSRSEVAAVIGYPRMIEQIKEKGFSKTFLFAEPFPYFFASKGKTLANYEYFVINRNSENTDIATDFMEYLVSDE